MYEKNANNTCVNCGYQPFLEELGARLYQTMVLSSGQLACILSHLLSLMLWHYSAMYQDTVLLHHVLGMLHIINVVLP